MAGYTKQQLDHLGERFRRIRLPGKMRRMTFAHYLTRPEHYDRQFERYLKDWQANPRLAMGHTVYLN